MERERGRGDGERDGTEFSLQGMVPFLSEHWLAIPGRKTAG